MVELRDGLLRGVLGLPVAEQMLLSRTVEPDESLVSQSTMSTMSTGAGDGASPPNSPRVIGLLMLVF